LATGRKIYEAIVSEEKEVFIWWYIKYLRVILDLLPLRLRIYLIKVFIGEGMRTFVGRATNENHPHKD
jgi:hypothetical protein